MNLLFQKIIDYVMKDFSDNEKTITTYYLSLLKEHDEIRDIQKIDNSPFVAGTQVIYLELRLLRRAKPIKLSDDSHLPLRKSKTIKLYIRENYVHDANGEKITEHSNPNGLEIIEEHYKNIFMV